MLSIYDFKVNSLHGEEVSMGNYKGKVLLIVNVASKCGFTPQYEGLQNAYDKYREQGLEVLGFPCNQFFGQEPGSPDEIAEFCSVNYGVSFDILEKIEINGPNTAPIYQFLKKQVDLGELDWDSPDVQSFHNFLKEKNPISVEGKNIRWNFTKFLVDRQGKVFKRYETQTKVEELHEDIEKLLAT